MINARHTSGFHCTYKRLEESVNQQEWLVAPWCLICMTDSAAPVSALGTCGLHSPKGLGQRPGKRMQNDGVESSRAIGGEGAAQVLRAVWCIHLKLFFEGKNGFLRMI